MTGKTIFLGYSRSRFDEFKKQKISNFYSSAKDHSNEGDINITHSSTSHFNHSILDNGNIMSLENLHHETVEKLEELNSACIS